MSLSLCGWPGAGHTEMFHGGKQHPQTQGLLKLDLCCFPPSWPVPVPPWSCLTGVAMPHHSCTRIWPQPLPAMGLANSLQLNRQQERCPQEFVRTCPEPIPLLAVAWVCFTPAISASKHIGGKSLGIFFFHSNGSSVRHFFPGILSLSLPGRLNGLFSLCLALTFLRARPQTACWKLLVGRSGLAGATPVGKRVLDVHSMGSGCKLESCQHWVVFPQLTKGKHRALLWNMFVLWRRGTLPMARGRAVSEDGLCSSALPGRLVLLAQCHVEAAEFGVCGWDFSLLPSPHLSPIGTVYIRPWVAVKHCCVPREEQCLSAGA